MTDKDLIDDLKTANQGLYELKDKLEAQLATATAQVERMRAALEEASSHLDWAEKEAEDLYQSRASWRELAWGEKIIEALDEALSTNNEAESDA